jgi:hypothetical protein
VKSKNNHSYRENGEKIIKAYNMDLRT